MKSIVIYRSKTGYTKQYAIWLSELLQCECIEFKQLASKKLESYDKVIYGGGIYASKINGLKGFQKQFSPQKNQEVILFGVGSSQQSDTIVGNLLKANEITEKDNFFYLQGGFDPEKLSVFMRFMLKTVAKNIEKKVEKKPETVTKDDQNFLDFFRSTHNDLNKENLSQVVEFINY